MGDQGAKASSQNERKPPDIPLKGKPIWRELPPGCTSLKSSTEQLPLPPNYQRHLHSLIAQAATQVSIPTFDAVGGSHLVAWDQARRAKWVEAVWEVVVGDERDSSENGKGNGFMDLPTDHWIPGVQRRKDAFKARTKLAIPSTPLSSPSLSQTQKLRLSVMTPSDRPSTPNPESGANSTRRPSSPADVDEAEAYKDKLRAMQGYRAYEGPKWGKRDWVRGDDDYAQALAPRPTIPGAFPHTDAYVYESSSPPSETFHHPRDPSEVQSPPVDLTEGFVKVVYCLHVPASTPLPEDSIHTRSNSAHGHPARSTTASTTSTVTATASVSRRSSEVVGSWNRWGSTKTLSSVQSNSSLRALVLPENVKVEFWQGRFSLGSPSTESDVDSEDESKDGMSPVTLNSTRGLKGVPAWSEIISGAEDDLIPGEDTSLVGGTFVLRGLSADEQHRKKEIVAVEKMLRILIYTLHAMRLELAIMDAYGVPREVRPRPLPPKAASEATSHPRDKQPASGSLSASVSSKKGAKSFLAKLGGDGKSSWGSWLRRKDSKSKADDALSRSKTRAVVEAAAAPALQPATETPPPELDPSTAAETVAMTAYERHIQTLHKLQSLKLSTTPGLVFPMPPLLLRIAAEDQERQDYLRGSSAVMLQKPRASAHRLGGDIRAGLNAIWPHSETYEGWVRLQSLDALYSTTRYVTKTTDGSEELECLRELCLQPHHISYRYFDAEKDETLGQKLDRLFNPTADDVCPAPTCDGVPAEHEQSWTHAGMRVVVESCEIPSDPLPEADEKVAEDETWVECQECGACSEVRFVGELARLFSWGRYLELLFYCHSSFGPSDICPHTQAPRRWHFRRRATHLRFRRKSVDVLETRLPKLQVGPNVAQRKPGTAAAVQAVNALLHAEEALDLVEKTRREIEAFYVSLERVMASMKEAMSAPLEATSAGATSVSAEEKAVEQSVTLSGVVAACRNDEAALYEQLEACPVGQINNVRRRFLRRGRSAQSQMEQLQSTHKLELGEKWLTLEMPVYFTDPVVHVLPGSSVLVREDDPSSVIAYTLSSLEYNEELTKTELGTTTERKVSERRGSVTPSLNDAANDATSHLSDFDDPGPDGYDADSWSSEVRRKDTPRDLSLLNIRSITKKKSDGTLSLAPSIKTPLAPMPQAPASLEVSLASAEGKAQTSNILGDLVRTIGKATASTQDQSISAKVRPSILSINDSAPNGEPSSALSLPSHVRRARNSTFDSGLSYPTGSTRAPPSAFKGARHIENELPASPPGSPSRDCAPSSARDWSSSISSNFSNSFSQLMSMGDTLAGSLKMRSSSGGGRTTLASLMSPLNKLSTMDTSMSTFDDKPHISFSYNIGARLKLTCTIFYATAFDSLRRRCAIDKSFVSSLAQTADWDAQGGKSKACFFKTSDDRFIVKELVSKWGASDTHALLEIAPSYFEHVAASQNRATSLAKIVGFYSVRIQDASGGNRRTLDLLVMENIFHEQKISRSFDLKGIEGRKVPVKTGSDDSITPATLFDGEWLEGQRRSPILLHPHSKRMLREAISNDVSFLSQNSIMDYSLLLGLDKIRHELVTGIVDAIGSYNLLKTLESRGKLALNRGGEVTIIPPDQYRDRFETAMKQYFISCPDKWSRPPPSNAAQSRPMARKDVLPSVV